MVLQDKEIRVVMPLLVEAWVLVVVEEKLVLVRMEVLVLQIMLAMEELELQVF
tara:strand:+ start:85 stop:243 length:159 start_codon:yes stop_codon:yes gene_type:complete